MPCPSRQDCACFLAYKEYRNENWIKRGVPSVLVILPNGLFGPIVSTSVTVGLPKLAWFHMLKKSVVKRRFCLSVSLKFLISEKSQFCWPGPRKEFLARLPKPVVQKLLSNWHSA